MQRLPLRLPRHARLITGLLAFLLAAPGAVVAESGGEGRFVEGEHYAELTEQVRPPEQGARVTEFFSYGCIHCFRFDSTIEGWKNRLSPEVEFQRVPAVFSRSWLLYAQAYYVARACGVLEHTHTPFFRAIHLDGRRFLEPGDVAAFYAQQVEDVPDAACSDREDFLDAFDSFGVNAAVQQAMAKGRAYEARGVPAMIVNGTWRTDGRMAGSNEAMLDVVDHLVERARADASAEDDLAFGASASQ